MTIFVVKNRFGREMHICSDKVVIFYYDEESGYTRINLTDGNHVLVSEKPGQIVKLMGHRL